MKSVPLQTLFASLVVLVAAGGLTLGFGTNLFRPGARGLIGTPAMSSIPASAAAPGSSASLGSVDVRISGADSSPKKLSTSDAPTFDIVRVERDGDAVVAGRSAPGAPVELLRGNEVLAREIANRAGEFVIIPPRLPPGSYKLALRAKLPDGTDVTSERSVDVHIDALQQPPAIQETKAAGQSPLGPAPIRAKDTTRSPFRSSGRRHGTANCRLRKTPEV